jgi:hypothetical protein
VLGSMRGKPARRFLNSDVQLSALGLRLCEGVAIAVTSQIGHYGSCRPQMVHQRIPTLNQIVANFATG